MSTAGINAKHVEAMLLDQDIKSGKLAFDEGMARVAEAAGEALEASAEGGALKVKGRKGAKSSVTSKSAEAGVSKLEEQNPAVGTTDPKKLVQQVLSGGGEFGLSSGQGAALGVGVNLSGGTGQGAFQILPADGDLQAGDVRVDELEGKS